MDTKKLPKFLFGVFTTGGSTVIAEVHCKFKQWKCKLYICQMQKMKWKWIVFNVGTHFKVLFLAEEDKKMVNKYSCQNHFNFELIFDRTAHSALLLPVTLAYSAPMPFWRAFLCRLS